MAKPSHTPFASMLVLPLLALTAMLGLTGCMSPHNDRSYVGTDPQLVAPLDDLPYESTYQLDRSQWTPTTINIPVDNTAHRPTYNSNLRHTRITTRQRNEFPTAEQALELTGDSGDTKIAEVPVVLGSAIIDAVALPVRMVTSHQGMTHESPNIAYQRTPQYKPAPAANETESPLPTQPATSMTDVEAPTTSDQAPRVIEEKALIGTMTPMTPAPLAPPAPADEDKR